MSTRYGIRASLVLWGDLLGVPTSVVLVVASARAFAGSRLGSRGPSAT